MRRGLILSVLLLLPFSAVAQDKDPQKRFAELELQLREVRRSAIWEDIKKRRDIVEALAGLDHPKVVPLLYEIFTKDRELLCRIPAMTGIGRQGSFKALRAMVGTAVRDKDDLYVLCLPQALRESKDPEIGPWMLKNLFSRKKSADVRAAVIQCLGHLRCSEAYEPILAYLSDEAKKQTPDLRSAYESLIALGRIGKTQAWDPVVPFLEHKSRVLRQGAVLGLEESGHPGAVAEVLPLAKDASPRVQEAVAGLIRAAKADEGIPALIQMLRTGRLRVIDTAREALEEITGESFGIDPDAWEHWYKKKLEGTLPEEGKKDEVGSVATYYGLKVFSDRVLFILDVSGSMDAGEPPRIDTAREELRKTLDQLNKRTQFNVVAFASGPRWWKDAEVPAKPKQIADAKEFVEKSPVGGGTNIYDTFEQAFEKNKLVDTIYFLGDGSPSLGTHIEQEEILARLRWMNRFRRVRIHCIALLRGKVGRFGGRMGPGLGRGRSISNARAYDEEEAARFLAKMAAQHDGSFVKIDK